MVQRPCCAVNPNKSAAAIYERRLLHGLGGWVLNKQHVWLLSAAGLPTLLPHSLPY